MSGWLGAIYRGCSPEEFAHFQEIHARETAPAPVCPMLETILREPGRGFGDNHKLTPIVHAAAFEARELATIAHHMRRESWWDVIPERAGARGEVRHTRLGGLHTRSNDVHGEIVDGFRVKCEGMS